MNRLKGIFMIIIGSMFWGATGPMEVVKALDGETINDLTVVGYVLPVTFQKADEKLVQLIDDVKPDAIVMLGLAAGRYKITPE